MSGVLSGRARTAAKVGAFVVVAGALLALTRGDQIELLLGEQRSVLFQALITGLLLGGVYSLVAMGLTLIFGVLDIINFAHGALLTVAMYASFLVVDATGVEPYLTLLVVVPVLFGLGVAIQRFLIQPATGQPLENQLLVTLGLSLIIGNLLLFGFGATPRTVHTGLSSDLTFLGASTPLPRVIAFGGALIVAGALYYLLQRTRLGTSIRAVAANRTGAALVGIDSRRVQALTFGLGAACVGAAGTLMLPFLTLEPTTGEQFNILAFVVVVLGGLGSVPGALIGGLIIGVAQEVGGVLFPGQSKLLLVLIVFVIILLLRPQGLLGARK